MNANTKSYTRIEPWAESSIAGKSLLITDVDDTGRYYSRCVWPDGTVTGERRTTVQAMGWPSAKEFMKQRKGFVLTGC